MQTGLPKLTYFFPLFPKGSGCIAALECEKFLVDEEVVQVENGIEADKEIKKGSEDANGDVPEYRSNPLL